MRARSLVRTLAVIVGLAALAAAAAWLLYFARSAVL
jgi:hypothetical protein